MSYFGKQLWQVLTRPFKLEENGECYNWVQALGLALDESREIVFTVRRMWFIRYAQGKVLDIRGDERDLARWYDEGDEDYKKRVEGAFALYAAGGTLPGMKKALKQIGYGNTTVAERSGPTWSHFLLSFEFVLGRTMGAREWAILNFSVWRMKPAHTMPRYLFTFRPEPPQKIPIKCKSSIYGEIKANHTIWLGTTKFYYINGSLQLDGSIILGDGWCKALYINDEFIEYVAIDVDSWKWRGNPLHKTNVSGSIGLSRPFVSKTIYRLDGSELLNGYQFLDALRGANTNLANHNTFVEFFDENGISQGKETLH